MTREEAINEIKSWDFLEGKEIEAIHTLIPELRESEDERIRKEIIDFIQWAEDRGMTRHDYHQAKRPAVWIAYLEKQKECVVDNNKTSVDEDESIRKFLVDYFASYKIGNVATKLNGVRIDDILNYLEKQKETLHILEMCKENANSFTDGVIEVRSFQRGLEEGRRLEKKELNKMIVVSPEVWDNAISDAYENGKKEGEKQKDQKHAEWSEEDKHNLNSVINLVHATTDRAWGSCIGDRIENWLKNLPERFNLQPKQKQNDYITPHKEFFKFIYDRLINVHKENPNVDYMRSFKERINNLSFGEKQEWSEEDEEMLNSCISSIEEAKENRYAYKENDGDTSYDREIAWLKSLRPSWKPSEEQMNCLCATVDAAIRKHNESVSGYKPARVLKSLYEQLKKLM